MPLYNFEAVSDRGKKLKGWIDADNLQDAKIRLAKRQIAVLSVALLKEKQLNLTLSKKELLALTREVGRLLEAGLPLFEALSALEEKYRAHKMHRLLLDLCDRVRSGSSFSSALSRHPFIFDVLYVSMIANAEKTGSFARALEELATLLQKQLHIKKQVVTALLYPSLLFGFCLVILSSLLFFVIPSLKELFEGRTLHPFTQIVFVCSEIACHLKPLLLALLLGAIGAGVFLYSSPKARRSVFLWGVQFSFFKKVYAKVAFVRFCRASSTLLEGGLPVITAFQEARSVMDHPLLEKVIALAEKKISEGAPLHMPFENQPLIPPLVPRMIAIAEQGGRLPCMMKQIAEIYEEELENLLTRFAALAQPLLLLVLGGVVGFVLLSVLLPLTDVSSFSNG